RGGMLAATPQQIREEMASVLSQLDFDVFSGALATYLRATLHGALDGGADGWIDDDLAFVDDWGFELGLLSVPTLLLQGEHDLMVPPAHFRWLDAQLPSAEARFASDEGHLTLYERVIPTVHE